MGDRIDRTAGRGTVSGAERRLAAVAVAGPVIRWWRSPVIFVTRRTVRLDRLAGMESWSAPALPRLPGRARPVALYDSATGAVRPTTPAGAAKMYVCGITPYDAAHLGHAATMITLIWSTGCGGTPATRSSTSPT